MTMTIDQILDALGAMALFIPVPAVQLGIPALVAIARAVEKSGVFDASTVVELDDVGKEYAKAVEELIAELARQKALAAPKA